MILAPIILFVYSRSDTLEKTINTLKINYLASESDLIIYSDGPKSEKDFDSVEKVRSYLKTITGFKTIQINLSDKNKGLAKSTIYGVTEVLKSFNSCIVVEDDLVSSRNYLNYMNEALYFYEEYSQIFSIAGFSIPIVNKTRFDVYFTQRANSTGWATWKDRWEIIDWEVKDYGEFKSDIKKRRAFNKMGSDMCHMLDKQMVGKLNSWAIRWCYHQFKYNLFSVHPFVSKIENIGFGSENSTNTKEVFNRFETVLDKGERIEFNFSSDIKLDKYIIKQFTKPFMISSRVKYKLINVFNQLFN
jgi:hypothetical protein